jgi:hypothetical protein
MGTAQYRGWLKPMAALASLALATAPAGVQAQQISTTYGGGVGGGWAFSEGQFGRRVRNGYDVTGELLILAQGAPVGIRVDAMYSHFGASPGLLNELPSATGGSAGVYGALFNLVVGPPMGHGFHPYTLLGLGAYGRRVSITRTTGLTATFNDPYWGFKNETIASAVSSITKTELKFGTNYGGGLAVGISAITIFAEIRYHIIYTNVAHTNLLPITLGLRL